MTEPLFPNPRLSDAFADLRRDLVHEDGPRISTMRNYRFAILQYEPKDEFAVRGRVRTLAKELQHNGWVVISIDLKKLFMERIRQREPEWLADAIAREKRLTAKDPDRGLRFISDELAALVEGEAHLCRHRAPRIAAPRLRAPRVLSHQSSPWPFCREALRAPVIFFSLRRRFTEPRVGFVARRSMGRTVAASTSWRIFSSASSMFWS